MVDTVALKADFRVLMRDYRDQIEAAVFEAALPILGDDFAEQADLAMAFLRDLLEAVERVLDAYEGVTPPPTAAELAIELGRIEGVVAEVDASGNLDFTFDTEGLVGGVYRQALETVMLDSDLGLTTGGFDFPGVISDLAAEINARLAFELDVTTGLLTFDGTGATEFEMSLTGDIDLDASAQLGFLGIEVEDRRGPDDPELNIDFSFDFPGIGMGGATAQASFDTVIDLGLMTTLPSDVLPTVEAGLRLEFNAVGQDLLAPDGLVGVAGAISLYDIAIDMNGLADFFDSVFGQLTRIMDSFPIGVIIDVLTERLPVVDDLAPGRFDQNGDGIISLRDLAGVFGPSDQEFGFIDALISVLDIIDQIDSLRGLDGRLELGDIGLSASATAALGGVGTVDTDDLFDTSTAVGASAQDILDGLGAFGEALEGPLDGLFGGTGAEIQASTQLLIPWLDNPLELIGGLLFNGLGTDPVTLIELDLPPLEFGAEVEIPFNFGPIGIDIFGGIDGAIDFSFGYDTSGIAAGGFEFADGFFLGSNLNDGFGSLGLTVGVRGGLDLLLVEAGAEGSIRGEILVNLVSSSTPDAEGNIKTYLSDLAVFPCIFEDISGTLTASAALYYEVGFGFLKVSDRFELASVTLAEFELPDPCPLSEAQDDPRLLEGSNLASELPSILMLNVGSRGDERNGIGYGENGNPLITENFLVTKAVGTEDDPASPGEVVVNAFGVREHYGETTAYTRIYAHGGQGNDQIAMASDVEQRALFNGGAGNDVLIGALGDDELIGDGGADFLSGGEGEDQLLGGAGADTLVGGAGADLIDGGSGVDKIDYSDSDTAIEMEVILDGPGYTYLRGIGGDAQGDIITNVETVIGSDYDDILRGNTFASNVLQGGDGDDFLEGGQVADLLMGGRGADELRGGETDDPADDDDSVTYALSTAAVWIDLATGVASGGDATGDTFFSIENFQLTDYGDFFTGDAESNVIEGRGGADILFGGLGSDTIRGGEGGDTIYAWLAGDSLDGGGFEVTGTYAADAADEADTLSYEFMIGFDGAGTLPGDPQQGVDVSLLTGVATTNGFASPLFGYNDDTIIGMTRYEESTVDGEIVLTAVTVADHSSFETLIGSAHNDELEGDMRANTIIGGLGNDVLRGAGGNDWLIGGAGADEIRGGNGVDWVDYSGSSSSQGVIVKLGDVGEDGDAEGDTWFFVENVLGSNGADTLIGDAGDNILNPGEMQFFDEIVHGEGGIDTLQFVYAEDDDIVLTLDNDGAGALNGQNQFGQSSNISLNRIERTDLTLGSGNDSLISLQAHDDFVSTGEGDDNISMGLGRDMVLAGDGDDIVLRGVMTAPLRGLEGGFGGNADFETFWMDGGDGLDTLWIDLHYVDEDITLIGNQPNVENTNEYYLGGGFITGFERFGAVATGSGDDYILQYGQVNNVLQLGAGADRAITGLGFDYADGGESGVGADEDVDVLVLNYANQVFAAVISDFSSSIPQGEDHQGTYELRELLNPNEIGSTVLSQIDFKDFETLIVYGSQSHDVLFGTANLALNALNVGGDEIYGNAGNDEIDGLSGGDYLDGGAGDDKVIGNLGDDTLIGGFGEDELIGDSGDDHLTAGVFGVDDGFEYMTGGSGADTFVLGDERGRFYDKNIINVWDDGVRIMDFTAAEGDVLVLTGDASEYSYVYDGTTSYGRLQHTETIDNGDGTFSYLITVTAQLEGVTSLNLNGPNVTYISPVLSPSESMLFAAQADEPILFDAALTDENVDPETVLNSQSSTGGYGSAVLDNATISSSEGEVFGLMLGNAIQNLLAGATVTTTGAQRVGADEAYGSFTNAFGMGLGIVLSTGDVTDILGPNLEDNSDAPAPTSASTYSLSFEEVTTLGDSTIYRAEIPAALAALSSITLADGNLLAGAGGRFSGFDMDAVILSRSLFTDLTTTSELEDTALDVFGFNPRDVSFTAGTQRDTLLFPIEANLANTFLNSIDFVAASLGSIDASVATETGAFAMGDGGSVRFDLNQTVDNDTPLYLYVAEAANNGEGLSGAVRVEGRPTSVEGDLSTDFGQPGAADDRVYVETTFDLDHASLGFGDTITGDLFRLVIVTEELPEFGGTEMTDLIDIRINGQSAAVLRDGEQATLDNLALTPFGGGLHPDLILNPTGTGTLSSTLSADAYTHVLTVSGTLRQGTNTISFEVADGRDGLLDTAIFLSHIPDNRDPHAEFDVLVGQEDTPLFISIEDILGNDSDIDGDLLGVSAIGGGESISVSTTADGILVTPDADFSGLTQFSYTLTDGNGGTAQGTVLISFEEGNDAPEIAGDFGISVGFGSLTTLTINDLQALDDEQGADELFFRVSEQVGGEIEVNGVAATRFSQADLEAGLVRFRHDGISLEAGQFTVTANDSRGLQADAPVTLIVDIMNLIEGGTGDDELIGTSAGEILSGLEGDDTLRGNDGVDILIAGSGSDDLLGGAGSDLYRVGTGDNDVFINEAGGDTGAPLGGDRLILENSSIYDLAGDRTGSTASSLRLTDASQDISVIVNRHYEVGEAFRVVELINVEGRTLFLDTDSTGGAFDDLLIAPQSGGTTRGGDGHDVLFADFTTQDTLRGENGDDILFAGRGGTDILLGGSGSDHYVVGTGDGQTLINEAGSGDWQTSIDRLVLRDSDARDLSAIHFGDSLYITDSGVSLQARLFNQFDLDNGFRRIEEIELGDGSIYRLQRDRSGYGTSQDDFLVADRETDVLDGGWGDDLLLASRFADVIVHEEGDGDDLLIGFDTSEDQIDLSGHGIDLFISAMEFAAQVGADTVFDFTNGDSLTLADTDLVTLTEDNFLFG